MIRTILRRGRSASGAVVAQLAQALTSLVLQLAAVRVLGAEGLGTFALLYSGVLLATAIVTGLVGDSLTVLDRTRPAVRGGLQTVGLSVAALAGTVSAVLSGITGLLAWRSSVIFGAGIAVFLVEDLVRRLLMASLRFWSVVAVDVTALAVTIAWLATAASFGSLGMAQLLFALLLAQGVALATAVRLLPTHERWLAPWRGSGVMPVLRFGGWRAAQQGIRPATLTVTRILVVAAAGTAIFGQLEAARVYTAPTLLIVNGIGGFLFVSYATERDRSLPERIHRADLGTLGLFVTVLLVGAMATVLTPWAGRLVTGSSFSLDEIAVFGWVVYAATTALVMPYGGLAAVSGMHVQVFVLRLIDSAISVGAVAILVFALDDLVSWVPYALAVGAIGSAAIIRRQVLTPERAQVETLVAGTIGEART